MPKTNKQKKQKQNGAAGGNKKHVLLDKALIVHPNGVRFENWHQFKGKSNTYLASLRDPWNVLGARIPDQVTVPSVPVHVEYRIPGAALAGGDFGFSLQLSNQLKTVTGALSYRVISSVASGAYTWGTQTFFPGQSAQLANAFSAYRLVSAAVCLRNDSAFTADQGRMAVCYVPTAAWEPNPVFPVGTGILDANGTPLAYGAACTIPYMNDVPASNRFIEGKYCPLEISIDGVYSTSNNSTGSILGTITVLGFGMAASAPVDVEVALNFECIPIMGIQASAAGGGSSVTTASTPSWSDPTALAHAANSIAQNFKWSVEQRSKDMVVGTPFRSNSSSFVAPLNPWVDKLTTLSKWASTGLQVGKALAPLLL